MDFDKIKEKPTSTSLTSDIGSLFKKLSLLTDQFAKEHNFSLPLLKDKYHKERFKIKTEFEKEFEALKSSWWITFPSLSWIETLDVKLKEQNDFMKFCKLSDQCSKAKTDFVNEKKSVDELMTQKAQSHKSQSILAETARN